jgi:hypothetical protein
VLIKNSTVCDRQPDPYRRKNFHELDGSKNRLGKHGPHDDIGYDKDHECKIEVPTDQIQSPTEPCHNFANVVHFLSSLSEELLMLLFFP